MNDKEQILSLSEEQRDRLLKEYGTLLKQKVSLQQALREHQEKISAENEELLLELLEVFDSLEFFLNYVQENPEPTPQFISRLPKSLASLQKKLLNVLERRKVNPIDFQDTKPDFRLCQVVDRELRDDLEEQTITKTVRRGFSFGDKILRPIQVITSKKNT
jgi:molecular chaperone GrpE